VHTSSLFVHGKLVRLFTAFVSSIEVRQYGIDRIDGIDFARQSNEHCLAWQPRAIDTNVKN
jgi:hypothetical protein